MKNTLFQALVVSQDGAGSFSRVIRQRNVEDLPAGDVLIRVHYSSLNYKDALSATGAPGVTRVYPHTPGIDAAGVVAKSDVDHLSPGDEVIVIGYDLGMNTSGGFGQYIRVPANWVVARPPGLSLRESMMHGTAGFTAAMSVARIVSHDVKPEDGEILVTGSTGGVGSISVALLAQLGYHVTAATGKTESHEYLRTLGASEIVDRGTVLSGKERPILKGRWAGVVDTVGGDMLGTALKATQLAGAVAACGNAASYKLDTTVFPFILRGVVLYGIDSGNCSLGFREGIWGKLAKEWRLNVLGAISREVPLDELDPEIDRILKGGQVGRVYVNLG